MRLALTHAYSWPDVRRGGERVLHELSRALARRGHKVTVLSSGSPTGRSRDDGVTTIRFRRRHEDAVQHESSFGRMLTFALIPRRFDCVHSLGPLDALGSIRASRVTRHRTVYTNLGIPLREWWDAQPYRIAHERVVRDVDAYGCLSSFALEVLQGDYGRAGVLTPGGVRLSEFTPSEGREATPTILFSGALDEPRKGLPVVIEALARVAHAEPKVRLWLSGPGDATGAVASAPAGVREHIEVLPLGDPSRQSERYGRAWVTVLPSKHEAFGLVLVESLACGTPVVASDGWALPELVSPGATGVLCDPDDPVSVAESLLRALDLSRKPGIVEACRAAAEPYDWESGVAPAMEAVYSAR